MKRLPNLETERVTDPKAGTALVEVEQIKGEKNHQ